MPEGGQGDPGWRPAWKVVAGFLGGRGARGSILLVMRAAVLFLGTVAIGTAVVVLVFRAGSSEPTIEDSSARIAISVAVGLAAVAISVIGRSGFDMTSEHALAVSLFQIGMRRILVGAAVGPVGFILSWMSGDGSYVIFGAGLAILLMAVAGPTKDRLVAWQRDVDEAGADLSVLAALSRPFSTTD